MLRAHIKNTSSTLSPVRALVSRNVIPDSCANLLASRNVTCLCTSIQNKALQKPEHKQKREREREGDEEKKETNV